jgi:ribosomal protein S12 methylthiotransferase
MKMKNKNVYLLSLGCNKNTVDSEIILSLLKKSGYDITDNPGEASSIIINTCAFIEDAKQEAIDTILSLAQDKRDGAKLIVTGCFSQLHSEIILREMPEVDCVIGIGNLASILDAVTVKSKKRDFVESRTIDDNYREYGVRNTFLTLPGYAYLKISEGCSRHCSFCLIPAIKGKMRSRDTETIINEAKALQKKGINELILTSQDTVHYGHDLKMKSGLKTLLNNLLSSTRIRFIRLLYLSPSEELLNYLDIFKNKRLLPYFDIPIQHISKKILMSMNRTGNESYYRRIIEKIREQIPEAVLRTTIIVGYPGESEQDFYLLHQFIKEIKFNHLGVFTFSPQEGTEAFYIRPKVPKERAEDRKIALLETQRKISRIHLEKNIEKTFDVLIEEKYEDEKLYIGRSYHFAPEVDGVFLVRSHLPFQPGSIIKAKVTKADDYDLHGILTND